MDKSFHNKSLPAGRQGFTLVELLVTITIIAILATIGLTIYSSAQKSARDSKRIQDLRSIAQALGQYKTQNKTYIPSTTFPCVSSWGATFNNGAWGVAGSQAAGCPTSLKNAWAGFFQGMIPQDPYCSQTSCSNTWPDYFYEVINQGETFTLSAKLENAPSPVMSGCRAEYNYCVKNQL